MTMRTFNKLALAGAALLACSSLLAQQAAKDPGKREYDSNCATCHGTNGKGNGDYVEWLKRSPPDLTTLTQRNAGVFPITRLYEVIEGVGSGHGSRDMPIWGQRYSSKAAEYYIDVPYNQEAYVRARILWLVEYINRLQAK